MTRPDTITLAGVELRWNEARKQYESERAFAFRLPDTWCAEIGISTNYVNAESPTLEALDTAVRAALAETFRALAPLVPAEVEAIRREERERCAAVCLGIDAGSHPMEYETARVILARIRALGPVQP